METLQRDTITCFTQGLGLLSGLSGDLYNQAAEACYGGSIGRHYRHLVEHYQVLLSGAASAQPVNYDKRKRDMAIETNIQAAQVATNVLVDQVRSLTRDQLGAPLKIHMATAAEGEADWCESTLRRELLYVLSHAIHHYALIGTICRILHHETPADFGIAPSTLRHRVGLAAS